MLLMRSSVSLPAVPLPIAIASILKELTSVLICLEAKILFPFSPKG
jgi:hypothetical protein